MRIYIFTVFTFIFFTSCRTDPNKQIDEGTITENIYHSEEIGWTIEIPQGWNVTKIAATEEREERGLKIMEETSGTDYDLSGLKNLISFDKGESHMLSATSEKFELEYYGDYEKNNILVKKLIVDAYAGYGIKFDTISSIEKIDDLEFDLFHVTLYDPDGNIMLYQDLYSKYINGHDFGVSINYINDKEKRELIGAWKNSKFE